MALIETTTHEITSVDEAMRPKIKPLVASYSEVSKTIEPLSRINPEIRKFWGDVFSDLFGNKLGVINNYEHATKESIERSVRAMFDNEHLITQLHEKIAAVPETSADVTHLKADAASALTKFSDNLQNFRYMITPKDVGVVTH